MRKDFGSKPWLLPQPVLILGTFDENGHPDAMNAAWGGMYDTDLVELCLSAGHKTTKNILKNKAFTISFPGKEQAEAADYVGMVSGNQEANKVEKAGWHAVTSRQVDAPLFEELPVAMECTLEKMTEDGNIIGKIVNVAIDESVLDENGRLDYNKFVPILFDPIHNGYHVTGERVGNAFKDGLKRK